MVAKTKLNKPTFTMILEPDLEEKVWLAELKEEPRAHTFGRTLSRARHYMEDVILLWFELKPGQYELREELRFADPGIGELVAEAASERRKLEVLTERSQTLTGKAVKKLVNESGLSQRDAAELLGISFQRVQQLAKQSAA